VAIIGGMKFQYWRFYMKAYKKLALIKDGEDIVAVSSPVYSTAWMPNEYGYACLSTSPDTILEHNNAGIHALKEYFNDELRIYKGETVEVWLSGKVIEGEKGYRAEKAQTNIKVVLRPKEFYYDLLDISQKEYKELLDYVIENQNRYIENYFRSLFSSTPDFMIEYENKRRMFSELSSLCDRLRHMLAQFA
jgi:hypothetical protein